MELQVGVKVLLKNTEGKFLLLKRSPEKYPEVYKFGDVWDIVGGRIDAGLSLIENLKREIKEEVGLDLKDEPKLVAAQDIMRIPGKHVVRLTYLANIEGEPRLDEDHVDYKWCTLEELEGLKELDVYFKELLTSNPLLLKEERK
ncbi:MAG: NUDIX hydrolase [Candidatus Doudnabacteria bacterium]|nr:NUDIX hydrolase [Candidatus Doudnabacteria bacterium]